MDHIEPIPNEVLIIKKLRALDQKISNLSLIGGGQVPEDNTDYAEIVNDEYGSITPTNFDGQYNPFVDIVIDEYNL